MPYVTSFERLAMEERIERGREEGREEGLRRGIQIAISLKFGEQASQIVTEIDAIDDVAALERILDGIQTADSVEQLRSYWQA